MTTAKEKAHLSRVAALGCIVCGAQAQVHHIRAGRGMALRASHYDTIPLCPPHHTTGGYGVAIHSGQKEFEKRYGTERELLSQVRAELGMP